MDSPSPSTHTSESCVVSPEATSSMPSSYTSLEPAIGFQFPLSARRFEYGLAFLQILVDALILHIESNMESPYPASSPHHHRPDKYLLGLHFDSKMDSPSSPSPSPSPSIVMSPLCCFAYWAISNPLERTMQRLSSLQQLAHFIRSAVLGTKADWYRGDTSL
ncbi:hypothetical protein M413DRAFT_25755 [Hebeloma cylindrosporum]|uniref:Uncharacterized protein n=1 Tax=Hebeloma cylindrosporum TaxID=76867 RepID=A0A0C3CJR3_HEBCY|nr:hypothetical protein M413DRAFT_25755 [Hebeloma cylindrosporum h7]